MVLINYCDLRCISASTTPAIICVYSYFAFLRVLLVGNPFLYILASFCAACFALIGDYAQL